MADSGRDRCQWCGDVPLAEVSLCARCLMESLFPEFCPGSTEAAKEDDGAPRKGEDRRRPEIRVRRESS